jgi:hypothetical protein
VFPVGGALLDCDADGEPGCELDGELGGVVGPPAHDWPLTVQLAGLPVPVAMNPNDAVAPGARVPFHPTSVKL